MGVELLTERYQSQIVGVLSCYDRIIIQGTVPKWCYAQGMTDYFYEHQIRIFDYPRWAEPLRDAIRESLEHMAAENRIEIEFIRSKKNGFRQEKRVQELLDQRGEEPGLVCILSAMEPCHYDVYFIDPDLGLCSVRVPTWCQIRLKFLCNGFCFLVACLLCTIQIGYSV